MRAARLMVVILAASWPVADAVAQTSKPRFEVASVKRYAASGATSVVVAPGPGTRRAFDRVATVAWLIQFAYDLRDYQVEGGPDWVRRDRFEIAARADRDVPLAEMRPMVQSLLEERFGLVVHRERRDMPIHTLVLAREDGRLGPGLRNADADCKRTIARPSNLPPGAATSTGCGSIDLIARMSSRLMASPVIDETGLTGAFEFFLFFGGASRAGGTIVLAPSTSSDPNLPSFPTAVQEQLGLRLQPTRGAVDVLVIDSVEPPSEN